VNRNNRLSSRDMSAQRRLCRYVAGCQALQLDGGDKLVDAVCPQLRMEPQPQEIVYLEVTLWTS